MNTTTLYSFLHSRRPELLESFPKNTVVESMSDSLLCTVATPIMRSVHAGVEKLAVSILEMSTFLNVV